MFQVPTKKEASMAAAAQKAAAEAAISAIGAGYDVTMDLRLKYCKRESPALIGMERRAVRDISIPGGICIPGVPECINCDKGDRVRASAEAVSFQHMSERFNQELGLSGKIPTGHFNSAFDFSGAWQKDAASTKSLALDAVSLTLFSVALRSSNLALRDQVRQAVPSSWDPAALARFIDTYGTHVTVGVRVGGKDTVVVKQAHSSSLSAQAVEQRLKAMADRMFERSDPEGVRAGGYEQAESVVFVCKRKGGSLRKSLSHEQWCHSVYSEPELISASLVPISSLLSGINGSGFLTHAINLYMRYKPPIGELAQFLDFQLPRQWAPVFGELAVGPSRKGGAGAALQFSLLGPKLYVNTAAVEVGERPVTGVRLYLEGKRSNCLAVHLQHLTTMPTTLQLRPHSSTLSERSHDRRYYERVHWKSFSQVCTAPVEAPDDNELALVTGAHLEVAKNLLFLRLRFSTLCGAYALKRPEWGTAPGLAHKSGIISTLISTRFSNQSPNPNPSQVNINSAVYPGGPPLHTQPPKLLKFVDTTEMTRGPQDSPGYWAVSGARLLVDNGKISIRVKYSLFTLLLPDDDLSTTL